MKKTLILTGILLLLLVPATALAVIQDNPVASFNNLTTEIGASATIDLNADFVLDPYLLRVIGGGEVHAATLADGCVGFVTSEASVTLNWTGESEALYVFVYSDADPVLVIETPDGEYLCSDDADYTTTDPLILLENPAEGSYMIHVGSISAEEPFAGWLGFTEGKIDNIATLDLAPMLDRAEEPAVEAQPQFSSEQLMHIEEAVFGESKLSAGFARVASTAAGGGETAAIIMDEKGLACAGFVSLIPSHSFTWEGKGKGLSVLFESEVDSTLYVITPEGDVLCAAGSETNLNPVLDIASPIAGEYDIYIGAPLPDELVIGLLTLTADLNAEPVVLAPTAQ